MIRLLSAVAAPLFLFANLSVSTVLRTASEDDRRLWAYETIAYYEPKSQVTDQNAIDLDQLAMEEQLSVGSEGSFEKAWNIYSRGGHSRSVAIISLEVPLTRGMAKNTPVSGVAENGLTVTGTLFDNYPNGISTIEIQYTTTDSQESYVGCQVGGLPDPRLDGCFARNGTLVADGMIFNYSYDPKIMNINKRTIRRFSTSAEKEMFRCEKCPYVTFKKYKEYYQDFEYADAWVDAAFDGDWTKMSHHNAFFGNYGFKGRAAAIKTGTAIMSIWMHVIRKLENSLDGCKDDCKKTGCNDPVSVHWDEAVAFYTGSLEGGDGNGNGKLLHAIADQRCINFKTCGDEGNSTVGMSYVNHEIFRFFTVGSRMLAQAKCSEARKKKEGIERLMTIPLIQGTLRNAYTLSKNDNAGEKVEAEGATYAAAVLPIVHQCDEKAAEVIFRNMKTKIGTEIFDVNFLEIKKAFEKVYPCIGIRGSEVGGIWDEATGSYFEGAEPMPDIDVNSAATGSRLSLYTITATVVILISLSF